MSPFAYIKSYLPSGVNEKYRGASFFAWILGRHVGCPIVRKVVGTLRRVSVHKAPTICVTLNHSYWADGRRGAVSVEGSPGRGSIHQTEIYSDRAGISA